LCCCVQPHSRIVETSSTGRAHKATAILRPDTALLKAAGGLSD